MYTRTPNLVLVADDYDGVAELTAELLERSIHCETIAVHDGAEALGLSLARRPAACVLDVDMPKMSGIEVARALREVIPEGAPLLIAVTGGAAEQAGASGVFDAVLDKPLDVDELVRLVRDGLAHP